MMKRTIKWMMAAVALWALLLLCGYDNLDDKVFDNADLLSEEEEEQLQQQIQTLAPELSLDLVIVTEDDARGMSAEEYARAFYEINAFGYETDDQSGLLFLIDMDNSEIFLYTAGTAVDTYPDDVLDEMLDHIIAFMYEDDSYGACGEFLETAQQMGIAAGEEPSQGESEREAVTDAAEPETETGAEAESSAAAETDEEQGTQESAQEAETDEEQETQESVRETETAKEQESESVTQEGETESEETLPAAGEADGDGEPPVDDRTTLERAFSPFKTIVRLLISMVVGLVVVESLHTGGSNEKTPKGGTYQKKESGKIRDLRSTKTEITIKVNEKGEDGEGMQDLGTIAASQEDELLEWEKRDADKRSREIAERRRIRKEREREEREEREREEREERRREREREREESEERERREEKRESSSRSAADQRGGKGRKF